MSRSEPEVEQRWYSRGQLATRMGKSVDWVDKLTKLGEFTPCIRGGSKLYDIELIEPSMAAECAGRSRPTRRRRAAV